MKKIVLGIFIFLILVVFVAPFLIPAKKVSDKISSEIESHLHKKTSIESVHFSIFPQLGIRVSGLSIGEQGKSDYFVTLKSFFVQLQWMPLLKKRVEISSLDLSQPNVEVYAEKATAPVNTPTNTNSGNSNSSGGIPLNIKKLSIEQGIVTMFDAKKKQTFHMEGFSEDLAFEFAADGTSRINGTTKIPVLSVSTPVGNLGRDMKIEIQKKIQIDSKNLKIEELKIMLGQLPITLSGSINDYASDQPNVDLTFSGGPSDIQNIVGLVPANMISADLKNIESKGNLAVEGKLKGKINTKNPAESIEKSDFHIVATLKNGSIKHPQLPQSINNISFTVNADPKTLTAKDFNASFGDSLIHYSAVVTNYLTKPSFQVSTNSTINLKDVATLHQSMPVKNLTGVISANVTATGTVADMKSTVLNGTIQTKDINLEYPDYKYSIQHLNSTMKFEKNNINLQNLSILINDSDLTAHGTIDNPMAMMDDSKSAIMKFALQTSSKNVNADKLMPPPSKETNPSSPMPDSFYKLNGTVGLSAQKLTFNKLDMAQAKGTVAIHDGVVEFKPLSVQVFNGTVMLNGNINLKDQKKPTFDLDTELKNIQVQKALAYADNLDKLLKLHDSLKGNIAMKAKSKGDLTKDFDLNMQTLNSAGSFSLTNATLQGHPIQKAFSSYFKSDKFQNINIGQWTQAFTVKNGRIEVNNLKFGAKDFDFLVNGWQSIDGKNSFDVDAKLPPDLTAKIADKLPPFFAGAIKSQKQLLIPLTVQGETSSPSVGLNNAKLGSEAKGMATTQLKESAKSLIPGKSSSPSSVKKNVKDQFKKIF